MFTVIGRPLPPPSSEYPQADATYPPSNPIGTWLPTNDRAEVGSSPATSEVEVGAAPNSLAGPVSSRQLNRREVVSGLWMLSRLADALEAVRLAERQRLEIARESKRVAW